MEFMKPLDSISALGWGVGVGAGNKEVDEKEIKTAQLHLAREAQQ